MILSRPIATTMEHAVTALSTPTFVATVEFDTAAVFFIINLKQDTAAPARVIEEIALGENVQSYQAGLNDPVVTNRPKALTL